MDGAFIGGMGHNFGKLGNRFFMWVPNEKKRLEGLGEYYGTFTMAIRRF